MRAGFKITTNTNIKNSNHRLIQPVWILSQRLTMRLSSVCVAPACMHSKRLDMLLMSRLMDSSFILPHAWLVGNLGWFHTWAHLGSCDFQHNPLYGLHQVRSEGLEWLGSLGCDVFGTGTTQEVFHCHTIGYDMKDCVATITDPPPNQSDWMKTSSIMFNMASADFFMPVTCAQREPALICAENGETIGALPILVFFRECQSSCKVLGCEHRSHEWT